MASSIASDCASGLLAFSGRLRGAGERGRFPDALRFPGVNPRAFALAMPALRLCSRAAGVRVLRFPRLRLPNADITARMVAFDGVEYIVLNLKEA